jgi:hypothetical protein
MPFDLKAGPSLKGSATDSGKNSFLLFEGASKYSPLWINSPETIWDCGQGRRI